MTRRERRIPNLAAYAGKWVVFSNDRVVASGASLPEAMRRLPASRRRLKPSVFLVPLQDEGPYVLVMIASRC